MPTKVSNHIDKVLTKIGRLDQESLQGYLSGLLRDKRASEQILDQINEGIIILDPSGYVRYANKAAFLWFGFERYTKGRSYILDLVEDSQMKQVIAGLLETPHEYTSEELNVLTPRESTLRVVGVPLETEGEKVILLRIENVTQEEKRNEEEANARRIESLVRLAAGVAHEIGNPLNSIQIHLELLKQETSKLPKAKRLSFKKLIEILVSETKRLDLIVRSFLRASRRPPLRFRKESLNEVVEEAVNFLRLEMKNQKIQPRLDLDRNIPNCLVDRDRLHQAFINLIKNAIEAMPRGGELYISTRLNGKICLVRFQDKGEGIDESHLPHIFEPYYTTKKEGSGLGLAQVYQTIREHGGRIDVKSRPKKGSVFTLALPLRQEPLSLPQPHENTEKPAWRNHS